MRKFSIYLVFIIAFLLFMPKVSAKCTYSRTSELKKIASNVNVTYTYNIVEDKATFDIKFANLTNDIYLYDSFNEKTYNQVGEIVLSNFKDGIKYRFFIKSNDKDCKDEILITKYVTLPKYNIYYGDPICRGIEDYALCQRWGTFNITSYTAYKTQINKYKESLIQKDNKNEENKYDKKIIEKVTDFFLEYYIFILSGIIVICLLLIYYLYKKDKFNF